MAKPKRLYLIDGYSNIFRAFYAIRGLSTSKGEPTNAVYGFINMLRKILRDEKPDFLGIALDTGGRTFRKEKYEEYKANRSPMPDDLKSQLPLIRKAIEGFRIPMLELVNYEADDVIGTVTKKAVAEGYEVYVVTADKDFFQLVSDKVKILHSFRDKTYDPALVEEDFGVPPEQVIDVLALMGDSSDNIPGVPGIGEKGAKGLIKEYGTLENLIEHASELKRKNYREGLTDHRDKAELSKELVTIQCELDVPFDPEALKLEEPDGAALAEIYRELEFFTLLKELEEEGSVPNALEVAPAVPCSSAAEWAKLASGIKGRVQLGLVSSPQGLPFGLAVEVVPKGKTTKKAKGGTAIHFADFRTPGMRRAVADSLLQWFGEEGREIAGHDLKEVLRLCSPSAELDGGAELSAAAENQKTAQKATQKATSESVQTGLFDEPVAASSAGGKSSGKQGAGPRGDLPVLEVKAKLFDSMLLAYLSRTSVKTFGLGAVAMELLHHKAIEAKQAGWEKKEVPEPGDHRLLTFAAERVLLSRLMVEKMEPLVSESGISESGAADSDASGEPSTNAATEGVDPGDPAKVYWELEEPLLPVLMRMEEAGVDLDAPILETMSEELGVQLEGLEKEIYEIAGEEFNINSPAQLGEVLFEKLGYPAAKKTRKTKKYSTNAETLEELSANGYEIADRILRFRETRKLKSTYVDVLPGLADSNGRLHTRFNQAVAATGRLSSANPNLQNIPVRTEAGMAIRKAFKAPAGWKLLVADYSQIELRVLAHIAEEKAMIKAFSSGEDIHQSTAASVFEVTPDLVTEDQRRAAKTINFGIIYGMSAFGLAKNLGITNGEAKDFIEQYFEQFPGVKRYTDETLEAAEKELCVTTMYGRTRWLPDIQSRNYMVRENAKRMAINARIQGTAADLLKLAMIEVDEKLATTHPAARLLLTVHDELVLEVPDADAREIEKVLVAEMEGIASLKVPLVVDAGVGQTWFEAAGAKKG